MHESNFVTAQQLIDRYGVPPRDICLDWAWQLRELEASLRECAVPATQSRVQDNTPSVEAQAQLQELDWSDLQVDQQGLLSIAREVPGIEQERRNFRVDPEHVQSVVPVAAITKEKGFLDSSELNSANRNLLRKASLDRLLIQTLQWCRTDASDPVAELPPATVRSSEQWSSDQLVTPSSPSKQVRHSRANNAIDSSHPDAPTSRGRNKRKSAFAQRKRRRLGMVASICLLTCGTIWISLPNPPASEQQPSYATARDASPSDGPRTSPATFSLSTSGIDPEITVTESAALLSASERESDQTQPAFEKSAIDLSAIDNRETARHPLDESSVGMVVEQGIPRSDELPESGDDPGTATPEQNIQTPQDSSPISGTKTVESLDLAEEVAEITAEASRATSEVEIGADLQSSPRSAMEFQLFPMMQIRELPRAFVSKARKPAWRLKLLHDEGFEVQPEDAQTIQRGGKAGWTLRPQQAEADATVVAVVAESLGFKGSRLRLRIAAVNAKHPRIMLPLATIYLDQIKSSVVNFQIRANMVSNRLQQMQSIDGMQAEARSLITSRRKLLEAQRDLADDLLSIASQADQLVGLLDGQISVAAEWLDRAIPNSPPLLQFGTLKSIDEPASDPTQPESTKSPEFDLTSAVDDAPNQLPSDK